MFKTHNTAKNYKKSHGKNLSEMIKYKAEIYGKTPRQISRWYPSSKICSTGGNYNKDLKYETEWKCPQCQKTHDRET